jgi:hypothetical protein
MEQLLDAWADVMVLDAADQVTPTKRTGGTASGTLSRNEREKARAKLKRQTFGGSFADKLPAINAVMATLLEGDGISLRAMPCGDDNPECSFSGTLLNRSEYIEPERGAIFARLGMRPSNWTMVGIIARFAPEEEAAPLANPAGFDRAAIEAITIGLMDRIESLGLSAAPAFPGIAVIPLALYRLLPWATDAQ